MLRKNQMSLVDIMKLARAQVPPYLPMTPANIEKYVQPMGQIAQEKKNDNQDNP